MQFGAGKAGIVFPASWLSQRIFSVDRTFRRALQRQITKEDAERDRSIVDLVRNQIQVLMLQGRVDEPAVARAFGMDCSTLRRWPTREGASFRSIVQDIQFEAAKRLICESDLMIAEVAAALGYAEISVFTRAFRRWSGATPSERRERYGASKSDAN